jgi:hypothetical protein
MLKRLVEGLQAEVHALRLEKEQDYGRFSGDIADHGQRIKSLEGKRDSGEELQDKARKVADYMDDVKAAKFSELRGKFQLSKFQLKPGDHGHDGPLPGSLRNRQVCDRWA